MKNLITCLVVCVLSGAAVAEIHHVPADFPTIQYAVDAASDGDEIIVSPGTYTSTAGEVVDMRGKAIHLQSAFGSDTTFIDGEGIRRVITCDNDETSATIIEGFTIRNGYHETSGGGVYLSNATPTIKNCVFLNNYAEGFGGGGLYSYSAWSNNDLIHINNCQFIENASNDGGGIKLWGTSAEITGCIFRNNTASTGGGINTSFESELVLSDCIFEGNQASSFSGGLHAYASVPASITNCSFISNSAKLTGGGVQCYDSFISGCTFSGNSAIEGGGVKSSGDNSTNSPSIQNSSFCENLPDAISGNWINLEGNQFYLDCADVLGACCISSGCFETNPTWCATVNGDWLGFDAICADELCGIEPGFGACCVNGEAIALYGIDCEKVQGTFMGEGTNPDDVTCPVHCAEDVTGDGVVDVSDLLAIIAVWGACP